MGAGAGSPVREPELQELVPEFLQYLPQSDPVVNFDPSLDYFSVCGGEGGGEVATGVLQSGYLSQHSQVII